MNDKYGWHDLRKEPKDLPEKWDDVLLYTMRSEYIVSYRDNDFWYSSYDSLLICETNVDYAIAWKNIEPFKEH